MYLRSVHFVCYYCGEEFDDEDDIRRRCGTVHIRGRAKPESVDAPTKEKALTWSQILDDRIKNIVQTRQNPDVYTGKVLAEQALDEYYKEQVKKLEDEKYRCAVCNKLFRGDEFVRKHIVLKHVDSLNEAKQKGLEEQFFLNYWNDPRHIQFLPNQQNQQQLQLYPQHLMFQQRPAISPSMRRIPQWEEQPNPYVHRQMPMMIPQPSPYSMPVSGRGSRGHNRGGARTSNGRGRVDSRYRPYPAALPSMPPPSGGFQDPRGIRDYLDLDAPAEDLPQIDYRTALEQS